MEDNIIPHEHKFGRVEREDLQGHNAICIWFTGLSGSGKSTIAGELEQELYYRGYRTYILDGDNIRTGLNSDLGFSVEDRDENNRYSQIANTA